MTAHGAGLQALWAPYLTREDMITMDPNETLRELRGMISDARDFNADVDGDLMAEKFEELDKWLSRGGFLPDAWHSKANLPKGGCATPGCKRCANAPE